MLAMSDRFFKAIRSSHSPVVRVDAIRNGGVLLDDLPIGSGSVVVDASSATRRQLSLTLPDSTLWDTLSQVGTELRVQRGVQYGDGQRELAAVGIFQITQPSRPHGPQPLSISAPDRWAVVARSRFVTPKQWDRSWGSVADAIEALMLGPWTDRKAANPSVRVPGFTNLMAGVGEPQRSTVWLRDRGRAITDLATSIGGEAYFDHNGDGVLRPIPTVAEPVWLADASRTGVLVSATTGKATEDAYNTVVVSGTTRAGVAFTAIEQITDPAHPLWIGGEFGIVPYFYTSPSITTQAQGVLTARTLLETAAAIGDQMSATCLPNPALEPGDTIRVQPDRTPVDQLLRGYRLSLTASDAVQSLTLQSGRPALPSEGAA
jgi:hypothetical protein